MAGTQEIRLRSWAEAVRGRPTMYAGDIEDGTAMHHMLYEVSVRDPEFNHQTRERLMNAQVGDVVRGVVERELARHLEATPALLDRILIDLE